MHRFSPWTSLKGIMVWHHRAEGAWEKEHPTVQVRWHCALRQRSKYLWAVLAIPGTPRKQALEYTESSMADKRYTWQIVEFPMRFISNNNNVQPCLNTTPLSTLPTTMELTTCWWGWSCP